MWERLRHCSGATPRWRVCDRPAGGREACEATRAELAARQGGCAAAAAEDKRLASFPSPTEVCGEWVEWVVAPPIPGTLTFDSSFTHAPVLTHSDAHPRASVGDLQCHRPVWCRGVELSARELAAQIGPEVRKKIPAGDRTQWSFTGSLGIPDVKQKGRRVILWPRGNSHEPAKMRVTHHTPWAVTRVRRGSRGRWTGTETLHRDGKPQVGLGDGHRRNGEGPTRHPSLVLLVHRLLVAQLRPGRVSAWAWETLTTIAEACRAVLRETLSKTISWAIERATLEGWNKERITAHLALV